MNNVIPFKQDKAVIFNIQKAGDVERVVSKFKDLQNKQQFVMIVYDGDKRIGRFVYDENLTETRLRDSLELLKHDSHILHLYPGMGSK